jgi:hypothetical protein
MGTTNDDILKAEKLAKKITVKSLKKWGVKHNGLYMGKIHYDLLIDDKAMGLAEAKLKLK